MIKIVSATIVACAALSAAHAAGPYDGIYQLTNTPLYYSVHQNGSAMIIAAYTNTYLSNVPLRLPNAEVIYPTVIDSWELYSGPISGNVASISGMTAYRTCELTGVLTFSSTGATMQVQSVVPTAFGFSQGVNCASLGIYATQTFIKEF